jgi:hypothetical protein
MATIDQKERYRQRAALCYEIAATLSGDTAVSMRRLGDSYTGFAEAPDKPRTGIFVPTKRHERPHCVTCRKEMRFTYSLPRTDTTPGRNRDLEGTVTRRFPALWRVDKGREGELSRQW